MKVIKNLKFIVLILVTVNVSAQANQSSKIAKIDSLLAAENYQLAETTLNHFVTDYFSFNTLDSLPKYAYYIGKVALENHGKEYALKETSVFIAKLKKLKIKPRGLYEVLSNVTDFYDEIGDLNQSLKTTQETLALILTIPDATPEEIGKVEFNLGICNYSLGELKKSKYYFKKALSSYTSYKETSKINLSKVYNSLGGIMWTSSRLDSATTFYNKAIEAILAHKGDPIRNIFQSAIIRSNISLVEHSKGNINEALKMQKLVLEDYHKVLRNATDIELVENTRRNELTAIYNLSAFYTEIGNLKKARDILEYSYNKAKDILAPDNPDLPQYLIAMGQSELSLQNYSKAIEFSKAGIAGLEKIGIEDPYWKGIAAYQMAKAYTRLDSTSTALHFFDLGEMLFSKAQGNSYNNDFLGLYREKALLLAHQKKSEAAVKSAKKAYNYLLKAASNNHLGLSKSIQNLCEVYYILEQYDEALKWSNNGLALLDQLNSDKTARLNSVRINFGRTSLLLLKLKSRYKLRQNRDVKFLKEQLQIINEATRILENRKASTFDLTDLNALNGEYKEINEYAKKLNLELYEATGEQKNFDKIISLQESGIYSRIRTKFNMSENIKFANIPPKILERETQLKAALSLSLNDSKSSINEFFKATKTWNIFLDSLKINHSKYYQMRYATIEESVQGIQQKIPAETTLVRYFFIENNLYAYVANQTEEHLVSLNFENGKNSIHQLSSYNQDLNLINLASTKLYNQLWKPIADHISTEKIIIFPDRDLFNLNFDLLSPHNLDSFNEFATKSLLAKYSISYNYSLLLLNKNSKMLAYKDDYVAYAPVFDENMKTEYEMVINDSINLDKNYLRLLPQPFSSDLVKKFSNRFKGDAYLNEKASKQLFIQNANEHKIIHIGTHAEADNISPELSRLVFAKNVSDSVNINDNYLYTYEIYNQNLSSNLAILTACETGKPSYQPGEGMISLAHAFNYAGSESILTSLWQIDEQSSTQILDYFYGYLEEGLRKDEALRKAKLDYLAKAEGRTLHPQYWAGLILMGDTSPIALSNSTTWWAWLIFGGISLLLLILLFRKRKALNTN